MLEGSFDHGLCKRDHWGKLKSLEAITAEDGGARCLEPGQICDGLADSYC